MLAAEVGTEMCDGEVLVHNKDAMVIRDTRRMVVYLGKSVLIINKLQEIEVGRI